MYTRLRHRGFTLLELVLVLVIICTALAVAAPSLRNWGRASYLRNAADEFVAATRLARTEAVATGQLHRLTVDNGQYQVTAQQGEQFVPVASNLGRGILPEGFSIQLTSTGQTADKGNSIDFFPTGRTQPAKVRITSDQGETLEIECAAPAESFRVLNAGDTAR
ncbi:MAG: GspH/FimT family pseudopilin [Tepidisphaeraceae bacterium]|jgi:type II secretion system protein H